MTRLTLEWHLRGIIEGTTEGVLVRQDMEWDEFLDRWNRTGERYYTDPSTDDFEQYDSQAEAGSCTTGFTQESGAFCDVYDVPTLQALNSGDPVRYLDAVAHDPTRRFQQRHDAAELLDRHIYPESPTSHENGVIPAERDDVDVSEWTVRRSVGPTYLPMRCANPDCTEGECLADPNVLRDEGRAECMVCGTEQVIPDYSE